MSDADLITRERVFELIAAGIPTWVRDRVRVLL
jgi:hypothetical protein